MSTKDVFDHHVKCFGEGDLQGILADYSPSAIMFTPDGPLKGIERSGRSTRRCWRSSENLAQPSA